MYQNSYIFWLVLGIIFLVVERKFSNIYNLSLACAFLFNCAVAYKNPDNLLLQGLSFLGLLFLCYFLIQGAFEKEKDDIRKEEKLAKKDFKNQIATVKKIIGRRFSLDGIGLIEYDGEIYRAKSAKDKRIEIGKKVRILSRENKIFNVEIEAK